MNYFNYLPKTFFIVFFFLLHPLVKGQQSPQFDQDPRIESKIDSLLAIMTLEEKIGQLTLYTSDIDVTGPTIREGYKEDIRNGNVGSIFNAYGAEYTRSLQ